MWKNIMIYSTCNKYVATNCKTQLYIWHLVQNMFFNPEASDNLFGKTWNSFWELYIYIIWANYDISPIWKKAIWGYFPSLTMIPVRSQWGRYNLPRYNGIDSENYIIVSKPAFLYVRIPDLNATPGWSWWSWLGDWIVGALVLVVLACDGRCLDTTQQRLFLSAWHISQCMGQKNV